jgi:hypothetical protein
MNDLLLWSMAAILWVCSPVPWLVPVLAVILFVPLWLRFWVIEGRVKRKMFNRMKMRL